MKNRKVEYVEKFRDGNKVLFIFQDTEGGESPDDWGDDELFLVGYHRQFEVRRDKIITKEEARGAFGRETFGKYWIFGLEAYIHSGVVLALSDEGDFPDRRWDVSQLGLVLVAKSIARMRKKARKFAEGLIETWNQYLSGDVYGFNYFELDSEKIKKYMNLYEIENEEDIPDEDLEDLTIKDSYDSCWGFYGTDWKENGLFDHTGWETKKEKVV